MMFVNRLSKAYAFLQQAERILVYSGWRWQEPLWAGQCVQQTSMDLTLMTQLTIRVSFTPADNLPVRSILPSMTKE